MSDIVNEMKNVDITKISVSELPNLEEFETDMSKSVEDRFIDYVNFVKNPYVFRVGDIGVKVNFVGDTPLYDAIKRCLRYYIH